jgi:hypothetical protein
MRLYAVFRPLWAQRGHKAIRYTQCDHGKFMTTIVARPRQDGSTGYTARVRIRKGQKVIHQESMTFSTESGSEKWAKRREVDLENPRALATAMHGETTLASLIRWCIDSFRSISQWQRSKQSALEFLEKHDIGKVDALRLTTETLITHVRSRRASVPQVWCAAIGREGIAGQSVA